MKNNQELHIKNMVCPRCIMTVENLLAENDIPYKKVSLGEVVLTKALSKTDHDKLQQALQLVGFELIETRINKLVEDIKQLIMAYLTLGMESQQQNLSSFITRTIPYDYSYLSDLFSSVEATTIEQYFILQRVEKVKELLVYDQLSLTEISYRTGFSSVHHLSAQFKKITGLTPSYFKKAGQGKRRSLDAI